MNVVTWPFMIGHLSVAWLPVSSWPRPSTLFECDQHKLIIKLKKFGPMVEKQPLATPVDMFSVAIFPLKH